MLNDKLTQDFSIVPTNYGPQLPLMGTFDSKRIVAFAKLEGIGHVYHMSDPEIYIGRRDVPDNYFDEPLEKNDSTSQRHIKICYNFATGRYELTVLQQINVYLEGHLIAMGTTVPLNNNANLQIGNASWRFVLPKTSQNSTVTHESNLNLHEEITTQAVSKFTSISAAVTTCHFEIVTKRSNLRVELPKEIEALINIHIFHPRRHPLPESIIATLPIALEQLPRETVCNIIFRISNSFKMGNTDISPALLRAVGLLE